MAKRSSDAPWIKTSPAAPPGFFETEAAGLRWLAETDTVPVVDVIDVSSTSLTLRRLSSVPPTAHAACTFGEQLANMHNHPAATFGELPSGASGYFFGPLDAPLNLPNTQATNFGQFYAASRLEPLIERCERDGALNSSEVAQLRIICAALQTGGEDGTTPARIHGDLWSGNLMWTPQGSTLIDPAACGGHPMSDIAMLTMFGCPHLEEILQGYHDHRPLPANWRDSLGLHQLFGYLVHLHLFGNSYRQPTLAAAHAAASYLGV